MTDRIGLAALTGLAWLSVFFVAIFTVKRPQLSHRLGMIGMAGMGLWVIGWLVYLGWWVSRHLCY